MNLDLFDTGVAVSPLEYRQALDDWLADSSRAGRVQRASSAEVYRHMWTALSAWCIGRGIAFGAISASDLEAYLASRGDGDDLSARYAWRLLRLVDRVFGHHGRTRRSTPSIAATEVLAAHPELRYANAHDADPLPSILLADEAKRLVVHLSEVRPRRSGSPGSGRPWQEVRNRASVGLMLGAGATPGDVRQLQLDGVVAEGGNQRGVPWKLRLPGNGNSPAHEAPVASWAGQLLAYWLQVRAEQRIPGAMVFPSTRSTGKAWGKVAQYNAAREVLRMAGIDDVEGGSYRLRHTFALRQLRRGKTDDEVARWLGVSDPGVMARYHRVLQGPADVV